MTFLQFALNNIKRNKRSYAAYFLSSVFSIAVFYLYASFIFHPEVVSGILSKETIGDSPSAGGVRNGIMVAEVIIFAFSFLFVLYSMGAFLHSRKKEFGLLTLLGITRGQINKLIIIENNVIGLSAITVGIGVGALFLKLFLMDITAVLNLDHILTFAMPKEAIMITVAAFLALFEIICFLTLFSIRTNRISEMIYLYKKPKKYPTYSIILTVISIGALCFGYYLAYTADLLLMINRMFPIVILVIIGTYFLYTQGSVFMIKTLQRRRGFYYRGGRMITISDLAFKLKDNARILFLVTILSAVAFTASGVLFAALRGMYDEAEIRFPQSINITARQYDTNYEQIKKQLISGLLKEKIAYNGHESKLLPAQYVFDPKHYDSPLIVGSVIEKQRLNIQLLSETDYNYWAKQQHRKTANLGEKQALFVSGQPDPGFTLYQKNELTILIGGSAYPVHLEYIQKPIITSNQLIGNIAVINDSLFEQIENSHSDANMILSYGMDLRDWKNQSEEVLSLVGGMKDTKSLSIKSRAIFTKEYKEMVSLPFFIGFFISCLFFLAAASILYFRLYNNMDQDIDQYRSLYRLGLTVDEMKQIITKQISILFFVPFFIATVHAGFAFRALQNMLAGNVIGPTIFIIGIFLFINVIYFLVVRKLYVNKIEQVM
ncbi:ABC transporter permease [Bacillus sp. 1P06AnD]|uniref:ABC transporter permease n=1 Tax=Bacillus sp. 1P06AnD TaxID=3132208 RepID=UPI0039A0754D